MAQQNPPESWEPVIEMIRLDDLRIDPGYQRNPDDPPFIKLKKKIVENFSPALLHSLDVSRWNNFGDGVSYFVYDGYCRLESLRELRSRGLYGDFVSCAVISVNPNDQADLFTAQAENRRGVRWDDRHHARLYKSDPAALAIDSVFSKLGLTLGKKNDVRAVQACYSTVEIDRTKDNPDADLRPDLLAEVLEVAGNSWTQDGSLASGLRVQYGSSDRMIDALALLLSRFTHAELDRDALVRVLSDQRNGHPGFPPNLVTKVAQKTSVHGSNNKRALAEAILKLYNKGTGGKLRASRLAPKKS